MDDTAVSVFDRLLVHLSAYIHSLHTESRAGEHSIVCAMSWHVHFRAEEVLTGGTV